VITADHAATFERCMAVGGVAVFGADTVYGLACEPDSDEAVERLYGLKGRRPGKPSAILFFSLEMALAALPELGPRTGAALEGLLPGPATVLLPNPAHRFPLACATEPEILGLRVPALGPATMGLAAVRWPVLQSSANLAGGPEATRLEDVPESIRAGVDLVLDAGPLDGVASTIVDLREFEAAGRWTIVRSGALSHEAVALALDDLPG
jgi:L-threonylcarbamoyladenylate synthase